MGNLEGKEGDSETLSDSITAQLKNETYVCLVCTENVLSTAKIWSCTHCYRVFDLDCIQDWAQTDAKSGNGVWRCPSCNFNHRKIPKSYRCWCGRVPNPTPNPLDPHSCGYTCGAQLKDKMCHHGCGSICHPGPHAQKCTQLGPISTCHCGKHEKQTLCSLTPYKKGWSCGEICDDRLGCGIHRCKKRCHKGLCGDCKNKIKATCYCGNIVDAEIKCSDKNPFKSTTEDKSWVGMFQCDKLCEEKLSCGNHTCKLPCHPKSPNSHLCPLSVETVTHCICGKTPLSKLEIVRSSCLDPIPTCDQICGKKGPCGHQCYLKCHDGPCAPCYLPVDVTCKCGSHQYSVACGLNQEGYQPQCLLKCNVLMSCRRHNCKVKCCPERSTGIKREADIKKKIRRNELTPQTASQVPVEAGHFCVEDCGKLLECGKHYCQAVCHPGNCSPCIQSEFEDLECNCGKTILHAPYRCGSKLPPCEHPCIREKECGHAQEPHNCHPDEIACPPCRQLTIKECRCEKHNSIANIICSQDPSQISCMTTCGKQSPCNVIGHTCAKECHLPGNCQLSCQKQCSRLRSCGHICKQKCHAQNGEDTPCPENAKCIELVEFFCKCGERSITVQCWVVEKLKEKQLKDREMEKERLKIENELEALHVKSENIRDNNSTLIEEPKTPECNSVEKANIEPAGTEIEETTIEKVDEEGDMNAELESNNGGEEVDVNQTDDDDEFYLPCTDKCQQQHRSRLMFNALQLSKSHNSSVTFEYKLVAEFYSPFVLGVMKKQPKWCLSIETIFRSLTIGKVVRSWGIEYDETPIESANSSPQPESRSNSNLSAGAKLLLAKKNQPKSILDSLNSALPSYHFRPMKSIQRKFIHELAGAWQLKSQAQDPEPKRSVFVKVSNDSTIPNINLTKALAISEEYEIVKKEEEAAAAIAAEAQRIKIEAEEREAKLREQEEAAIAAATAIHHGEKEKEIEEPKYWNSILIKDIEPSIVLSEMDEVLKSLYESSDLASIESQLAAISDEMWVLMFELGPQHNYKEAKSLLSKKVLQLCPLVEECIIENGWGSECLVGVLDDGVMLEIGDWSRMLPRKEKEEEDVVNIDVNEEDIIEIDEIPLETQWWS